jgi:hypothetical protein
MKISHMKDTQKIISIFVPREEFAAGPVDVTAKLYAYLPETGLEGIKYMMPTSTEHGTYFNIVVVEKKEKNKGVVGFTS